MYKPAETVIGAVPNGDGTTWHVVENLVSNGHYLRRPNGQRLRWTNGQRLGWSKKDGQLTCMFEYKGKLSVCNVADKILAERIKDYINNYFGKYNTNCAAFANFVMTGTFEEYRLYEGLHSIKHPMRGYREGQSVGVGDILGLFYANPRIMRSRRHGFRNDFRMCQKVRNDTGMFTVGLKLKNEVLTAEEISRLFNVGPFRDYHFMICVGHHQGKPVWLSQCGYHLVGSREVCFDIGVGDYDPYPDKIPVVSLIRRKR